MRLGDPDEHLLCEAETIVTAIGRMFPGLCEVVLHDLRRPENAIRVIENNLSGRKVGDSATSWGSAESRTRVTPASSRTTQISSRTVGRSRAPRSGSRMPRAVMSRHSA